MWLGSDGGDEIDEAEATRIAATLGFPDALKITTDED